METSFKRSHACTATLSAPTLQQATTKPCLCQTLLDAHMQIWVSLLWGHCSFLLGPSGQASVCALQESISQSCVSFGSSVVVLMATSPRGLMSYPSLQHPEPLSQWQSTADPHLHRRRSNTVLSQSLKIFYFVDIILLQIHAMKCKKFPYSILFMV